MSVCIVLVSLMIFCGSVSAASDALTFEINVAGLEGKPFEAIQVPVMVHNAHNLNAVTLKTTTSNENADITFGSYNTDIINFADSNPLSGKFTLLSYRDHPITGSNQILYNLTIVPLSNNDIVLTLGVVNGIVTENDIDHTNYNVIGATLPVLGTYNITASAGQNGSISPPDRITCTEGTDKTFTITADEGYEIADLTVDDIIQPIEEIYTFTNIQCDHTISANFTKKTYKVVIAPGIQNGTVNPDSLTAQIDDTVTLTATPETGYELSSYTVTKETGGSVEVTDGKFTMPADNVTVSATFEKITYNVIIASGIQNGTVNSDKEHAQLGDLVTLTAVPDAGYELSGYTVTKENGGSVDVTDGKFTMPADNVTVSASFSKKTYNVVISSAIQNGSVSSDKSTAQMGDTVTLTATPETGYELSGYTVTKDTGGSVEVIDGRFTMPADNVTVSAAFSKLTYNVVISDGIQNGTVTSDKEHAQLGDLVTLTAVPDAGYELSSYTVTKENGGNVEVTDSKFTMPADNVTVSASFSKKTYNVVISTNIRNGTVNSDKPTAQMGETVTLTAIPDVGYELSSYTVTKETGGSVEVTDGRFTMPADNVTVSAAFSKLTYNVIISDGILNGSVTSDRPTAQIGDTVTLTAVPESGYELSSYTATKENGGDVEVTDGKFTMPADNVTVSAVFSKKTYNVFISPDVVNATVTATPATAQIGDLITLTVEMHPGHIFTGHVVTNESGGDVPVSESTFIMPGENVTASITFTKIDYTIAISDAIINGTVTADKTSGQVNDLITLTAVPETGYQLTGYTVTTDTGGSIPVVNSRFPMPADNVTISAAFSKIQPKPSGGGGTDTGSGHYTQYPRNVRDGGYVSFGTSPIVTGVDLPKGTTGEVLLITVTNAAAPVGFDVYAIVEIEAPSIGQPATIYFTLNTDQIKAAGYTTKDIVLYHCKDGKWVPLTTKLIAVDGKNAKYSAETDSFSPFAIVYDEGKTIVSTVEPTVVPTTSPTEVPTVTETLPPVQTTTAQAKTPVPLAGLVLGLGAAVFLTRWMRH